MHEEPSLPLRYGNMASSMSSPERLRHEKKSERNCDGNVRNWPKTETRCRCVLVATQNWNFIPPLVPFPLLVAPWEGPNEHEFGQNSFLTNKVAERS